MEDGLKNQATFCGAYRSSLTVASVKVLVIENYVPCDPSAQWGPKVDQNYDTERPQIRRTFGLLLQQHSANFSIFPQTSRLKN